MMEGQDKQGALADKARTTGVQGGLHQFVAPCPPVDDQIGVEVSEDEVGQGAVELCGVVGGHEGDEQRVGVPKLQHLVRGDLSVPPLGHARHDDEQHRKVPSDRARGDGGSGQQQHGRGPNEEGLCGVDAPQFIDAFLHQIQTWLCLEVMRLPVGSAAPRTKLNSSPQHLLRGLASKGRKGRYEQAERRPDGQESQRRRDVGGWSSEDDHGTHHEGDAQPFAPEL